MSRPWGPQASGEPVLNRVTQGGAYWVLFAALSPVVIITAFVTNDTSVGSFYWTLIMVTMALGGLLGLWDGHHRTTFAHRRILCVVLCLLCATFAVIAYVAGYLIGRMTAELTGLNGFSRLKPSSKHKSPAQLITEAANPYDALMEYTYHDPDGGGGVLGWDGDHFKTASPRGGLLVLGPPGSGKTTTIIIPTVLAAIGPCVTTSMRQEVMIATWALRSMRGRNFQFDPSTVEPGVPGAIIAHWSPLVGIDGWDAAGRRAGALAQPHLEAANGNGKHFVNNASQIVAILLYAAHVADADMTTVYRWVTTLTTEDAQTDVYAVLDEMAATGDEGAGIALDQFKGYAEMSPQELAKYISSATEILEAYKYVSVRRISKDLNFDPRQFVRSFDTLHITVPDEYKDVFAPVVTALLDAIRNAAYEMYRLQEVGREPDRPHVTFVLDEVTNIAPVPLPQLVSQAGGQGLHVIAAMQSNTQAIDRWQNAAKDFLSMFPTKIILPGVADRQVLDTLSELTGEYDRTMMGYGESTTYLGERHIPVTQQNPNWSIQRQRVLSPADISNPPQGFAVMFQGGQWSLVQLAPVFQQFWQLIIQRTLENALSTHNTPTNQSIGGQPAGLLETRRFLKGKEQQ